MCWGEYVLALEGEYDRESTTTGSDRHEGHVPVHVKKQDLKLVYRNFYHKILASASSSSSKGNSFCSQLTPRV